MKKNTSSRSKDDSIHDIDQLIESYRQYLSHTRGLALCTINYNCTDALYFLRTQSKGYKIDFRLISPKTVNRFFLEYSLVKSASCTQHVTCSLRSFFRFLKQTQRLKEDLADAVLTVANRKRNSYPEVLSSDEITKLLQTCDKNQSAGRRNFAILMLLVHLGLRACEVCNLNLDDINWDNGEIVIRGKGGESRFPLFKELGEALVAYLKDGRPVCNSKKFFIRLRKPLRGISTYCAAKIFRSALKHANLNPKIQGTHLLRHSFAMHLLKQGATLEEIGMVLGHKDVNSTAVYARADFDQLRTIALPWPQHSNKEGFHE